MRIAYPFFLLSIFLFPYYVLPSGGFQPSVGALLIALALLMFDKSVPIVFPPVVFRQFLYVFWTFMVNAVWFTFTSEDDFLMHIAIGSFSCVIFLTTITVADNMDRCDAHRLLIVMLATLLVQLFIILSGLGRPGYRAIAWFNNPNQLGYFCVIAASIALIIGERFRTGAALVPAIVAASTLLAGFSLSKASMISCITLGIIAITVSRATGIKGKLIAGSLLALAIVAGGDQILNTDFAVKMEHRLNGFQADNDDDLAHRGYDRIVVYPETIIWGAGEGFVSRFNTQIELHSYPATILFSYGIIGVLLFCYFLARVIHSWRMLIYLTPLLFYNLTHHGGRTLLFWILLGIAATCFATQKAHDAASPTRSARQYKR